MQTRSEDDAVNLGGLEHRRTRHGWSTVITVATVITCCACGGTLGHVPRITPVAATDGFKMLWPQQEVRRCEGSFPGTAERRDLIREGVDALLARDPEADAVVNTEVQWESFCIGIYTWRCVVLRGDLVRSVRTVLLPMPGEHGGHH